jgi:hypothetical protein
MVYACGFDASEFLTVTGTVDLGGLPGEGTATTTELTFSSSIFEVYDCPLDGFLGFDEDDFDDGYDLIFHAARDNFYQAYELEIEHRSEGDPECASSIVVDPGDSDLAACATSAADDAGIAMVDATPQTLDSTTVESSSLGLPLDITVSGKTELGWMSTEITATSEPGVYEYDAEFITDSDLLMEATSGFLDTSCEMSVEATFTTNGAADILAGAVYAGGREIEITSIDEGSCGEGLSLIDDSSLYDLLVLMFESVQDDYASELEAAIAPECLADDGESDDDGGGPPGLP